MKKTFLLFAFATLLNSSSIAQDSAPDSYDVFAELISLVNSPEAFMENFKTIYDAQLEQMRGMGIEEDKVEAIRKAAYAFGEKIASDPEMESKLIEIYKAAFTEDEAVELIEFYSTPIGKKFLELTPTLTQKSMELGMSMAGKYLENFEAEVMLIMMDEF